MDLIVSKSNLAGSVKIPGSKSHTIRAVAIAALAEGESIIRNPLISSDTLSAVDTYRALGAKINTSNDNKWIITGNGGKIVQPDKPIDVGNSGTTLRVAIGSASLVGQAIKITFTGDEQIQSRPIGPLLKSLNDLGASALSTKGNDKAPLTVSGTLTGGQTTIECTTSQYLSSLLMACPLAPNDTTINVSLLNEPDYVQITLDWLDKQGIKYENQQMRKFLVKGNQKYSPFDSSIPADFSSATFFLCAAAILNANIDITGLDFKDSQPDKAVVEYLKKMGTNIDIVGNTAQIRGSQLTGTEIDMNRTPDALPAMAVTAVFAKGTTKLINVPQARNKETDRIACMAAELKKMSIHIEELPDGLIINHTEDIKPAVLNGYHDHRIVMALSIAGMALSGQTRIQTAQAIDVTFPDYVELMKSIGAQMEAVD